VKALAGARDLLRSIHLSGRKIGCATDCSRRELQWYLRVAGVTRYVHESGCGSEAKRGKPHADLIHLALGKLRSDPSATLMIGDTPSDAEAARKAGIPAIGVLTGRFRRCDLEAASCRQVFKGLRNIHALIRDS
jgi:HAD superfamily hydrolase (TIGR01549 family)